MKNFFSNRDLAQFWLLFTQIPVDPLLAAVNRIADRQSGHFAEVTEDFMQPVAA
ncbi:hypothetical protein ABVB23_21630 [Xanthomonas citri pv. mangiferaeindicae]|uniref:hypothetical protein n=1 Tax=Xanthomonas citri TaxID=346 RepID=UPI003F7D69C6